MENLFWAVVIGFSVTAFLLLAAGQEIGDLHKSLKDRLESIEGELKTIGEELGWEGTIHKELIDIGNAIDRSRQP